MSGKSELKINSQFAEKYEKYRQKEELQRLKDRYGNRADESDSESSESSSDDSEVELDPEVERDFYRTLSLLKKKDPKIYEKDAKFYSEEPSTSDAKPSTSKTAVKPMYLKDYERKVILEREGDEDDEGGDGDGDGDGDGMSQLLTRRVKTQEEKDKEEADYVEWLKGQTEIEGPEEVKDMKYLRDYWNDPELDEKECFLRDYVLNKCYLDDDDDDERIPTYDEVVQEEVEDSEEEGESFLERQEDFERSYNFRFEEPDAQQIKTYPRNIATSVRSKDERRKRKREEVKLRKEKEKEQKQEQLKQLKNLKRNEIMEKLKKLQELTGNDQLAFSQTDLEGDFDPEHHDQLMQKFFGDEYYGGQEEEKPQFDDDDEFEGKPVFPFLGDVALFNHMDADYDPSQEDIPQMGKKRKKSHFAEAITKSKPVFDPQEKSFEQYLDEYYKLDYEDIIDDLPCRFRYRQVVANDFGLTTDEILNANDKELNQWCSLKKTCMFRSEKEEMCDLKNYKIKFLIPKKKKMKQEEEAQVEAADAGDELKNRTEKPQWAKKKHKLKGGRLLSVSHGVKIGGRDFSRQRLKAYGLNPKRLYFRQLGRQKRKEREKKEKQKNKE
uniref:Protein KRI1 homolog n=1 Tax=Sphaeramia orbicularis TaxID=375764 RepID=A0A673BQ38_9TELE